MADIYKIKIGDETHNLPFLPLNGGTLTNSDSDILTINRTGSTSPTTIKFNKDGSLLGRLGFDADSKPVVQVNAVYNEIIHAGNIGSQSVNYANDSNKLDGIDSSGFFISNKGSVSVPYIDLTTYTSNHADYKNYDSGTYTVSRTGYSDTYVIFRSSGSTSAIELMSNYNDTARLKLRKTIDNNRVSGPWRELAFTTDIPASLPASDVYAWAKAANKPSYKTSEVAEETNLYFTNQRAINACSGTYLQLSGGDLKGTTNYNNLPDADKKFGTGKGLLHIRNSNTDNYYGNAITWAYNDSDVAQAGIYVTSGGSYGTEMWLGTTHSFANGVYAALKIDNLGKIHAVRNNFVGNLTGNCSGSSGSCTGNAATATKATQDSDGNTINSTYLKKSGGTLTGALTFANSTWNVVGDDAAIGDYNVAGSLGLKSINNNIPSIGFHNSSNTLLGTLKCDAGTLKWNTNTIIDSGSIGSQSVNYATTAGSVAWDNVSDKPTLFTAGGSTSSDLNTVKTNGSFYVHPNAANKPGDYGELLCMSNIDTHAQIYVNYSDAPMKFRGANNASGYYAWRTVIDDKNYTSYCAPLSHSHDYLPLSGGTMTGNITFDINRAIKWHNSSSYQISCPNGGNGAYFLINGFEGTKIMKRLSVCSSDTGLPNSTYRIYTDGSLYAASVTTPSIAASSNGSGAIGSSGTRFTYGYFNNSVYAKAGFYEDSDERLKDIEKPLNVNLDKLSQLRKVYFKWKEDPKDTHIGVIAQDIKELYPEIVTETDEGTLNVDYGKLSVIALDAVDQLNNELKEVKEKLNKVLNALNL